MRTGSVLASEIAAQAHRLTAGVYLSEDQLASRRLCALTRTERLGDLTRGRRVFRGPIFRRIFATDPALGRPYVSASDIVQADIRPAEHLSRRHGALLDELALHEGMILVTCSGMNLGRAVWTRADMEGLCASHDLIRIEPDPEKVPPGYLYAFLASRYGRVSIRQQIYGGNIKHVEPHHVAEIRVPRVSAEVEVRVGRLVIEASELLSSYHRDVRAATEMLFKAVGLDDITSQQWHAAGPDLGFSHTFPCVDSFRALNFNPRFEALCRSIKSTSWAPLKALCEPDSLRRGSRFKRVDADSTHAYEIIGQRELFALHPEGRLISKSVVGENVFAAPGTVLIAAQGTLGESELFCRAEWIWGRSAQFGYSEHLLRIVADESQVLRGCLFAFLRSESAFRMLRSISVGTKLMDHHPTLRDQLPIPLPGRDAQQRVHDLNVGAYNARTQAVAIYANAIAMVERAIEEG